MKVKLAALVCVVVLLFPAAGTAQFAVHGKPQDIAQFGLLLLECRGQSKVFADLLDEIDRETEKRVFDLTISLDMQGNPGGHFLKNWNMRNTQASIFDQDYSKKVGLIRQNAYYIDLGDIEQFPRAVYNPSTNKVIVQGPAPLWASTRCQVLAHELKEELHGYVTKFDYKINHQEALTLENQMRQEINQPLRSDDTFQPDGSRMFKIGSHEVIIRVENDRIRLEYKD